MSGRVNIESHARAKIKKVIIFSQKSLYYISRNGTFLKKY